MTTKLAATTPAMSEPDDLVPFLDSSAVQERSQAAWCTPQLSKLNPKAFGSYDPWKVKNYTNQQIRRIENEKLDLARDLLSCTSRSTATTKNRGKLRMVRVQIGRYPGMGPTHPVLLDEANWDVVWFAVVHLVLVNLVPFVLLAAIGVRGRELVVGTTVIGAPTVMVVFWVWVWYNTRNRPTSSLTDVHKLNDLVNGVQNDSNGTSDRNNEGVGLTEEDDELDRDRDSVISFV